MVQSQFSLCWDSYKSSICGGFSTLQQNGEFVDMTLAADGHFVKVHQVLVALASPYLKELISSAPCQHPIIFLNNVSYKTLCLILEYIYTGEVLVRADNIAAFADTCKSLHIKGLENIAKNDNIKSTIDLTHEAGEETSHVGGVKRTTSLTEMSEQICIPVAAKRIFIKHENLPNNLIKDDPNATNMKDDIQVYTEHLDDTDVQDTEIVFDQDHSTTDMDSSSAKDISSSSSLQFSVSIRGSLQIILNRYIYNLNSKVSRTGIRRWRCVEYRNHKCNAFVVTKGNVVLNRANLHNHAFHDKKILAKIKSKSVYSALDDIEGYAEREQRRDVNGDSANESIKLSGESYNLLDDYDNEIDAKPTYTILKSS